MISTAKPASTAEQVVPTSTSVASKVSAKMLAGQVVWEVAAHHFLSDKPMIYSNSSLEGKILSLDSKMMMKMIVVGLEGLEVLVVGVGIRLGREVGFIKEGRTNNQMEVSRNQNKEEDR